VYLGEFMKEPTILANLVVLWSDVFNFSVVLEKVVGAGGEM
jgi:hypothetical protein